MAREASRLRDILRFLGPYRRHMIGLIVLTLVLSVLAMAPPLIVRAIIDRVITPRDTTLLRPLALLLIGVPIMAALFSFLQTVGVAYVGQHFVFDVRDVLYRHLLRLSMRFHGKNSPGMLVNRLMGDSATIQNVITSNTISIISEVVAAVFALTATLVINWRLSLLLYGVSSVFIINYRMNINAIRRTNRRFHHSLDRLSAGVQNRLGASHAIKTFGSEAVSILRSRQLRHSMEGQYAEVMGYNVNFRMNMQLLRGTGTLPDLLHRVCHGTAR